jgi:hypothetical protein
MPISELEQKTFQQLRRVVADRADSYQAGVQTTILGRLHDGWGNLLTNFDFVCKGRRGPDPVIWKYPDLIISRRLAEVSRLPTILERLFQEDTLETGAEPEQVPAPLRLSHFEQVRSWQREWSQWPGDIAHFSPSGEHAQALRPQTSQVALDAPYYPSPAHVLLDLFGFRPINWGDYLTGQVIVVLPDFRARISKLTLGRDYLRVELDRGSSQPSELVAKAYAENSGRRLAQETIELVEPHFELNINDKATFASVALLSKSTGELLHEKSFDERRRWTDKDVIIKIAEQEIEQMLLLGETETVEFREKIEPVRLAKTTVAFANTSGGTIVLGVDDNHRVVGCDTRGLSDTVTNVVRDRCDPPPAVTTEVVGYQGRTLFLIRVAESKEQIHVEKEHGPLIRANATNRTPTSHELYSLIQRRTGTATSSLNRIP